MPIYVGETIVNIYKGDSPTTISIGDIVVQPRTNPY